MVRSKTGVFGNANGRKSFQIFCSVLQSSVMSDVIRQLMLLSLVNW